jgi:protein-S-isoprenylcysteine O-methyltransferase Ste14
VKNLRSFGELIYGWRGTILAVPGLGLIVLGRPSLLAAILGLALALAGEALRIWAVGYAGVTTRYSVLEAPSLATGGPYAYSRNPMYTGNLVSGLGYGIAFTGGMPFFNALVLLSISLGVMIGTYSIVIPSEERFLLSKYKQQYEDYIKQVPRLFPRLHPVQSNDKYSWEAIRKAETKTFITIAIMICALMFKLLRG